MHRARPAVLQAVLPQPEATLAVGVDPAAQLEVREVLLGAQHTADLSAADLALPLHHAVHLVAQSEVVRAVLQGVHLEARLEVDLEV